MGRKKVVTNPYDQYRARAYDAVANRNQGRIQRLAEVVKELVSLGNGTDVDALKQAAAWEAVMREDEQRTSPPPFFVDQEPLFGWPDPMENFWKLGDGVRVRVKDAKRRDHLTHLQLMEANEKVVIDAARKTRESYYQLLPHYLDGAETVAEAVEAFVQSEQATPEPVASGVGARNRDA